MADTLAGVSHFFLAFFVILSAAKESVLVVLRFFRCAQNDKTC
jgi:hypothetical protein